MGALFGGLTPASVLVRIGGWVGFGVPALLSLTPVPVPAKMWAVGFVCLIAGQLSGAFFDNAVRPR